MPWLMFRGFANALQSVAEVTTKGAAKYTPNGWEKVEDGATRYMEAFARHLLALGRGEGIDPDTKCLHKAQMIWNLMASLELELRDAQALSLVHTDVSAVANKRKPVRTYEAGHMPGY